jgi:hypothetical protein
MLADTEAIRSFAAAGPTMAADLHAAAAALSGMPVPAMADAFGPVGAGFLAALAAATAEECAAVVALGHSVDAAGITVVGTAAGYDAAERRAGNRVGAPAVGVGA